ncbi:MAG: efflux RND transporter periplasmic adaptor subunit [Gammaproteobacteria bacterium]|nr:efflux RND transporter periplasmic adaptor subunit [Gammaproteobacteria bacterium]
MNDNLARLRIERGAKPEVSRDATRRRWGRYALGAITAMLVVYLAARVLLDPRLSVAVGTAVIAYPAQAYTLFNATGYVVPQRKADVASKATGRLETLEIKEGSRVMKGQVIARLENGDLVAAADRALANVALARAEVAEARAALTEARLALTRSTTLADKRFVSSEVHDAAVARFEKAAAGVERAQAAVAAAEAAHLEAQVAVEYTLIRAPFDGVILSKYADMGDMVAPFATTSQSKGAVVSLADMGSLEVEADVSESNLAKTEIGQPCEVELDALPGARLQGAVASIVPRVDRSKATVLVKIRFIDLDARILPDMSAKVAFLSQEPTPEERQAMVSVPVEAVVSREGKAIVFVVREGRVAEVAIETGARLGDQVVVVRGVASGDRVVLDPPERLSNGAEVAIQGP